MPGPLVHWYVTPGVVELPVNVTLVVVQVSCEGDAILIFGTVPLDVIVTVDVAVHPFAGFVAVTVYVPAALTVAGLAALLNAPPFQTMVLPALVPVNVAVVVVQLILLLLAELTVGGVVFEVMVTVDVFVQPFTKLVDVTVYVPIALTVAGFDAFTREPPFHTIVLPKLVPVNVAVNAVHVKFPEEEEETVGGVVLLVIVTVDVAVHPLDAFVEVTVYVPAALTEAGLAALLNAPPFHTIVPDPVPVNVELSVVHVKFPELDEDTVGGVVFPVMVTVEVAVHPFAGFVAVTVYVPAALTEAGFAALLKAPPFHTIVLPALVPVNVAVVVVQLILLLLAELTVGGVVFMVATTVAVLVHPELVFVTVTV